MSRFENEVLFHNNRYADSQYRAGQTRFYNALRDLYLDYKKCISENAKNCNNILEVGCGLGTDVPNIIGNGTNYTGVDCSTVAIEHLREKHAAKNFNFIACDAHHVPVDDHVYDFIYAIGVLHHLDFCKAVTEIKRLSKNNNVLFVEPLSFNPLFTLYRFLTPGSRSADESPLNYRQIKFIKKSFPGVRLKYYGFFTLFAIFTKNQKFYNFLFSGRWTFSDESYAVETVSYFFQCY